MKTEIEAVSQNLCRKTTSFAQRAVERNQQSRGSTNIEYIRGEQVKNFGPMKREVVVQG